MHHRHALSRAHEVRMIIEQTRKEFRGNGLSEEEKKKAQEEQDAMWWRNYWRGMGVLAIVAVVVLGVMLALTEKHGGGMAWSEYVTHGSR